MSDTKELKKGIKLLVAVIAALLAIGTILFSILEGWNLIDSFYFVSMTATTVGYGDFTPTHTLSKIITVFYSLAIIPLILYSFTVIAKYEVDRVGRQVSGIQRKQTEQEKEITKAERRIEEQKRLIEVQQDILDKQERKLKKQEKITKGQEVELKGHQQKIRKQEKEIKEHNEELEVVEDIVEDQIAKEMNIKL